MSFNATLPTLRLLLLLSASNLACSRELPSSAPSPGKPRDPSHEPQSGADTELLTRPYAPARWRLAVREELSQAQLWASHILIAHRGVEPGVASFEMPDWIPGTLVPERTRKEAFELAQSLARRAADAPAEFARLAREHSEDPGTREVGGSLGGRNALELSRWPEVLDAFAALRPGQVSRVVETEYGFHVLLRQPPPEERRLSGAHLVIAHDQAPWLHRFLARRPVPARSRSEALALAGQVYRELQRAPDGFARLLEAYSDHRDALRGGDIGEWSSQESTPFYRELEVLSGLEVGEVAPPIDSPFGVQLILRTPQRPRQQYAMEAVVRGFDPALPDHDANSRATVLAELEALLPRLADAPQMFAELQARYCCSGARAWLEGRGDALDEAFLTRLTPGQLGSQLMVEGDRASIVRRLEPTPYHPARVLLELPEPSAPDVDYLVSTYGGARLIGAVEERAVGELGLEPETALHLRRLGDYGERLQRCESEQERLAVFREFQGLVRAALGAERFERYQQLFQAYVSERLLRPRPDAVFREPESGLPIAAWPGL